MPESLLQTKLFLPRQRSLLVDRPLLLDRLTQGVAAGARLTLVSAPAGFGKTTLVANWLTRAARPAAWLSLDERDQDLQRFLTYFVAALQTAFPDDSEQPGRRTQALLARPEPPPTETLLTTLLNEIAAAPAVTLVLDDYHLLDSPPVDEALAFLLDHLPPSFHLVLTSREDPQLPLPRLRVRGLLTEIRAADLRFDTAEIAEFLEQMTGLALAEIDLAALAQRTEGWIAGVQLAALSLQGRPDAHEFISDFAGDNRYVVDYLLDEVLAQQPAPIRRFLLETSILNSLCGALCDAICPAGPAGPDGQATLAQLERSNLFVIPLDDRRHWYRYHQLFADVLRAHLLREQPEAVAGLHQRASHWYETQGLTAAAIEHALAAGDDGRAAGLMELAWREMDRQRQSAGWLRWVERLPAPVLANRPVLLTSFAWALLETGQLEAAETRLGAAEQCLAQPGGEPIIVDAQEGACVAGTLAAARTYQALALGDLAGTMTHGRRALALLPADDHFRRATPSALLGLAAWAAGDLTTAEPAFAAAMASYQQAGNILFAITGTYFLAVMKLAQGRLRAAYAAIEASLQLAQAQGGEALRGAADLFTGLAELQLEQNDLAAAQASLAQSREHGEGAALPRWRFRWCRAQARLLAATGQLDEALTLLDEAERHYVRGPVPDVRPLATERVGIWLAQGRLNRARQWAEAQGLAADNELSYLREREHLCLARILIAGNNIPPALTLLTRLLAAAVAGERHGSRLEILVLQTLAHVAGGDMAGARPPLERALALAEPEGYIRLFIGAGRPLVSVLRALAAESETIPVYVHRLLLAAGDEAGGQPAQPLVEPLSERELEILGLLAQGLTNRQIASQLYLALSTVKGHNRNIYSKLQASRRTEAVARARELGLLPD